MTFDQLANIMKSWGYEVKSSEYDNFSKYLQFMLTKDRVMVIWNGPLLECVILYFLTDDVLNAYKKSTWEIPQDNPNGHQIYVEKMVCSRWNKGIRTALQDAIEEKFPNVTEGYYHRSPFDRCIKIYRRSHVQSPVLK